MNVFGYTFLEPGKEYIMMLNSRELAKGMADPAVPEFIPADAVYAKLMVEKSTPPEEYVIPKMHLSVGESRGYEILAEDRELYAQFVETKEELFDYLNVEIPE